MKCKKISYKTGQPTPYDTKILLGLIISQDENLINFKTAKKEYTISITSLISIEDTDIEFKNEEEVKT